MNKSIFYKKVYKIIDSIAFKYDMKRRAERALQRGEGLGRTPLTKAEKRSVKDVWGGGRYKPYEVYKNFTGEFSPYYVPDDYYDYAEHVLNLRWAAYFLQHKCNLQYVVPAEHRAKTVLRKVDGHFVTEINEEMSLDDAIAVIRYHDEVVVKKARSTAGGKGVQKINVTESDDVKLRELMMQGDDIEVEEILKQNSFMAQFNPDSINTIRILTLNINQKCTLLSALMRMGSKGSFVDNVGSGGLKVAVKPELGRLHDFGFTGNYKKVLCSPTGITFKDLVIPNWKDISQTVIGLHQRIPFANLISWDVAVREDGVPVIIEMNLDSCIVKSHQLFNGPIFGDRLEEVREYIRKKEPMLQHQMMLY